MIERQTKPAEPVKRRYRYCAIAACAALVVTWLISSNTPFPLVYSQETKPQQANDRAVRASLHNVKYRFAENVSVQINDLTGAIVPIGDHPEPVFDDKE